MKKVYVRLVMVIALVAVMLMPSTGFAAAQFAVWLDGVQGPNSNAILSTIDNAFGAGNYVTVTTADLETAGFLSGFQSVVISRSGAGFGGGLSATAAANVSAYVGSGATQGGVALFNWDAADNLFGTTVDPFDANVDKLFVNALMYAAASGHGYVGEFNGAAMALSSNANGYNALGLLQGNAGVLGGYGPQFTFDLGAIGAGHPINSGVAFPFTSADYSTYRTDVTGYNMNNVVDIFVDNQGPAIMSNARVPEPSMMFLFGVALAGLGVFRKKF